MIGRTNVGGGSTFKAYIDVSTEANEVITAVNPAGDTFTGTADNTGALTLTITAPGTYTVSGPNVSVETVVVADTGETYSVALASFDGQIIVGGHEETTMTAKGFSYYGYTSQAPNVSYNQYALEDIIWLQQQSGTSGIYQMTDFFKITAYTSLKIRALRTSTAFSYVAAIDENGNATNLWNIEVTDGATTQFTERTVSLSGLDKTKSWSFGIVVGATSSGASSIIADVYLATS